MARTILLAVLGASLVASTSPSDAAYQARPLPLSSQRVQPLPLPSLSSGVSRGGPMPVLPTPSRTGQPSVPQAPGISATPESRLRGSQQGVQEGHQAPLLHPSHEEGTIDQPPEERPEAVRVTEVKVVEEKKQNPPAPGATLLSADKAAEIALDETLKQQQKTREELEKLQRDDLSGVQDHKGPLNDAQRKWQEAVENEARDSGSHQEAEASLALKELIRKSAEQERHAVLAGAETQSTPSPVQAPEPQTQSSPRQRTEPSSDDSDDVCKGLEVTTTKMSSAPLAILYYFNPDSVIHFHSLSLLLPDGKTFLSDVRAVVRDAPPTDENPFPKSVAHLSGGYKLTLSLEGVKLEDHEGNEIASWEAETVLHPIILEEVSIRDAAAIAPAPSGVAAVSSAAATSAIPGGIPDSSLFQQGVPGGAALDNTQGGPEAIVGGGRAMKSVRVLPVSRGNVGSVRITTTNEMAPTMGAFTCVFRTGVFSDYDPCSSPSFISSNFFTPLVAMIVGGF